MESTESNRRAKVARHNRLKEAFAQASSYAMSRPISRRLWDTVLNPDEQKRLGGTFETAFRQFGGAAGMWVRLRGVSPKRAIVDIGIRFNIFGQDIGQAILRNEGEAPLDPGQAFEWAVAQCGLVLKDRLREAYWQGRSIEIDWERNDRAWVFLEELAKQSKAGRVIDNVTFGSAGRTNPGYARKLKSRLTKLDGFPSDLADLIETPGRGTYRLGLLPDRIRVFESAAEGELREWMP